MLMYHCNHNNEKFDFISKKLAIFNLLDENKWLSFALVKSIRRPDYCLGPHLRQMLLYGCTRLEIGVQSTYEDVARDTNRGHTVAAVADCFCLAKDAGFKVCYKWSYVQTLFFQQLKFFFLDIFSEICYSLSRYNVKNICHFFIQCPKRHICHHSCFCMEPVSYHLFLF